MKAKVKPNFVCKKFVNLRNELAKMITMFHLIVSGNIRWGCSPVSSYQESPLGGLLCFILFCCCHCGMGVLSQTSNYSLECVRSYRIFTLLFLISTQRNKRVLQFHSFRHPFVCLIASCFTPPCLQAVNELNMSMSCLVVCHTKPKLSNPFKFQMLSLIVAHLAIKSKYFVN